MSQPNSSYNSSRRGFLKGLGLATAGLLLMPDDLPRRLWALGAPLRLWGDGVHDDGPAIQALLAGRAKEVAGAEGLWDAEYHILTLRPAIYRVEATLLIPNDITFDGGGSKVVMPGDDYFMAAPKDPHGIAIKNHWWERENPSPGLTPAFRWGI